MSFRDKVMIILGMDTSEAESKIDKVMAKADAATEKARLQRLEIIQGVREGITLMSQAMGVWRQFMSVIGAQVDTFFSALIGMTLSTVSMLLSLSAALAATGVGAGAALLIGAIAIGLNVSMLTKLIIDRAWITGNIRSAADLSGIRTPTGGSF